MKTVHDNAADMRAATVNPVHGVRFMRSPIDAERPVPLTIRGTLPIEL